MPSTLAAVVVGGGAVVVTAASVVVRAAVEVVAVDGLVVVDAGVEAVVELLAQAVPRMRNRPVNTQPRRFMAY